MIPRGVSVKTSRTAAYGHFGRADKEFTWERVDRLDDLKSALSL